MKCVQDTNSSCHAACQVPKLKSLSPTSNPLDNSHSTDLNFLPRHWAHTIAMSLYLKHRSIEFKLPEEIHFILLSICFFTFWCLLVTCLGQWLSFVSIRQLQMWIYPSIHKVSAITPFLAAIVINRNLCLVVTSRHSALTFSQSLQFCLRTRYAAVYDTTFCETCNSSLPKQSNALWLQQ